MAAAPQLSRRAAGPAPRTAPERGLLAALALLAAGAVLVVAAYAVPRRPRAAPQAVPARELERLQWGYARLGARLDGCILAGLGLLALGALLLSALLLAALCRGRRRSDGSVRLRLRLRLRRLRGDGAQPLVEGEGPRAERSRSAGLGPAAAQPK